MAHAERVEVAVEHRLRFIGAAGVVRAAEVVDVVVALRAEVRLPAVFAAPGERAVVIDHHFAARGAEGAAPGIVEAVLETPAQVQ
ncbi:hypothetical protein D3C73_920540 [compost metagenome]